MNNSNAASRAYALVRIIIGFFLFYHGKEVFESNKIAEYAQWDVFKNLPQAYWIAFSGKAAELVAGIMIMFGFKTKWASVILVGTMLFISFFIGHGKVWYEDQHPFLFVLFGIQYFFGGAGVWSIDNRGKM
jgi:putative oxidoreductase